MTTLEIYESFSHPNESFEDTTFVMPKAGSDSETDFSIDFRDCKFTRCKFVGLELRKADFSACVFNEECSFQGCRLRQCNLSNAKFVKTVFTNTFFAHCDTCHGLFSSCEMVACQIQDSDLEARFEDFKIDRQSEVLGCNVEKHLTDIESFRQLRRSQRETRWRSWIEERPLAGKMMKSFWWLSDYGTSTSRLLEAYLASVLLFQQLYVAPCYFHCKPLLENIGFKDDSILAQLRSLYFSIVTSTTVGFGDVLPRADSYAAHLVVIAQIVFSYVLLSASLARITALVQE